MAGKAQTRTADRLITDVIWESPVDRMQLRLRRLLIVAVALSMACVLALVVWNFARDTEIAYAGILDHFKYGSIGSEPGGNLMSSVGGLLPPEPVFKALPAICPDQIPGGYASFGLLFEPGRELPIGISQRHRLGVDQVGANCALCHTGTYRAQAADKPSVVLGMPANNLDLQRLFRFVIDCTLDERFTADNVVAAIEAQGTSSGFERLLYRTQVVPRVREASLQVQRRLGLILGDGVTPWGRGRVDTFNPYKAMQFNWRIAALPHSELIGAADYPPLWNQRPRDGLNLHWDGNNPSVDERNLSAALGAGVTPVTVDHANIHRVRGWIWKLAPPRFPFPVDENVAARGAVLYKQHCVECHGDHRFRDGVASGGLLGQVTDIASIGTDRHRLDSYTFEFSVNQYTLYPDSDHRFQRFRKTSGYANQPLDGVWLRAPYLHNGSVPTLRDLLEPPERRPARFYKGYDVIDRERVGFVSDVSREGERQFDLFDTALPGNANGGHVYGVDLSSDEKDAIVEYMKKF